MSEDKQSGDKVDRISELVQRLEWLENRCTRLEAVVFPQFATQAGSGQKTIHSDPSRTETGMGPILNTGSEFI